MSETMQEFKEFAKHLSDVSGKVIKKYFRAGIGFETKADLSPVTIADKKAEEIMREEIMYHYPDHGILGEEFGSHNKEAEFMWVIDPIDGTKSFLCGAITFGTLIALLHKGQPVLGVINQPALNEFLIGDNFSAELNGVKVKARDCDKLEEAVLLTTDHLNIKKYQDIKKFEVLIEKVKLYRNWGDCYGYYLLSTGFADVMIDPIMSPWDLLSLIPIVKGSGAVITDYHGNDPVNGTSIIAAAKGIHHKIIELLN